jgi:hypothetical protein
MVWQSCRPPSASFLCGRHAVRDRHRWFTSVYEQDLNPAELATLVEGLDQINEQELAGAFRRGFELLDADGFYRHMNWDKVSDFVKAEIELIGEGIGDRLWGLDEKLAALLRDAPGRHA